MSQYPAPIGFEASGIIEAIGTNVSGFMVGDRVAYYASIGAYAERRVINTNETFKLPKDISNEQAAAVMIKGLTAHIFGLLRDGVFEQVHPSIYLLTEAATAHADMESRKTTGSIILKPELPV